MTSRCYLWVIDTSVSAVHIRVAIKNTLGLIQNVPVSSYRRSEFLVPRDFDLFSIFVKDRPKLKTDIGKGCDEKRELIAKLDPVMHETSLNINLNLKCSHEHCQLLHILNLLNTHKKYILESISV